MITMELHDLNAPSIGHGRWSIPTFLLDDSQFLKESETIRREALREMERSQQAGNGNTQAVFQEFLANTKSLAMKLVKIKSGKMNSSLRRLEKR